MAGNVPNITFAREQGGSAPLRPGARAGAPSVGVAQRAKYPGPAMDVSIPATDRAELGVLLSARRRELGLTQRQLEAASRIPQGRISRIERGVTHTTLIEVGALAQALQLNITLHAQSA